jgi:hypothetical protein
MTIPSKRKVTAGAALICSALIWLWATSGKQSSAYPTDSEPAVAKTRQSQSAASGGQQHEANLMDKIEGPQPTVPAVTETEPANRFESKCPAPGDAEAQMLSVAPLGGELWPTQTTLLNFEWELPIQSRTYLLKILWNGIHPSGYSLEILIGQLTQSDFSAGSRAHAQANEEHTATPNGWNAPEAPLISFATQERKTGLDQFEALEQAGQWLAKMGVTDEVLADQSLWNNRVLILSPSPLLSISDAKTPKADGPPATVVEFHGDRVMRYASGPIWCSTPNNEVGNPVCRCTYSGQKE